MDSFLLALIAVSLGIPYLIAQLYNFGHDTQEPPLLKPTIPIFGHAIGLFRKGQSYFLLLQEKYHQGIYRLGVPGQRMYIITSPDLIQAVQRQPKFFSFAPLEAAFSESAAQCTKESSAILQKNIFGFEEGPSVFVDIHHVIHSTMQPGPYLHDMNARLFDSMEKSFQTLMQSKQSSVTIRLVEWLQTDFAIASTDGVYGPENPYRDPKVLKSFWRYSKNFYQLLFYPRFAAQQIREDLTTIATAFTSYLTSGNQLQGSKLAQERTNCAVNHSLPIPEVGRFETTNGLAILGNTVPASFWLLCHIYSDPAILDDCRKELDSMLTTIVDANGVKNFLINPELAKNTCSIMFSTLQEVFRTKSLSVSAREVTQDTFLLSNQYLMKKGATVIIPAKAIHNDPRIWGSDVDEFKHRRFMKSKDNAKSFPPVAFRTWGGGVNMCPGRHWATLEIFAVAVMFVARFDMVPLDGKWSLPTSFKSSMQAAFAEPDWDIEVKLTERKGFENGKWSYTTA